MMSALRVAPALRIICAWLTALLLATPVGASPHDAQSRLIVSFNGAHTGAAIAETVVREHGLRTGKRWILNSLDLFCLEAIAAADDVERLEQILMADARISSVQSLQVHAVAGMPPKDPYFDLQRRTRIDGVSQVLSRGTGKGVRIAVVDTGVDTTHTELDGQISESINFVGGSSTWVPGEYHGTGVVGLIAAKPGNGEGIHGLAPDAELVALRACWEPAYGYGLCSTDTLAQALDYAIEIRARIINLSLAGPEDPLLTKLVARAIELGAVVFGAVGEDEVQSFPASVAGVIAVQQGMDDSGSTSGRRLTIPGQQLLTTVPGDRYDFVSGASFATAHASGVAAVMLEQQPHLQANDLVEWLQRLHGNTSGP